MSKSEISVKCLYTNEGEAACEIINSSFVLFLKRELAHNGRKFAISAPTHE